MDSFIKNKLAKVFASGKTESEIIDLIILNKSVSELIGLLQGNDIDILKSAIVKKLGDKVRNGHILTFLEKKQVLLNIMNLNNSNDMNFLDDLCDIFFDDFDDADADEQDLSRPCKICYAKDYNMAFLPCGHVVACEGCAARATNCPLCMEPHVSTKKIYFP